MITKILIITLFKKKTVTERKNDAQGLKNIQNNTVLNNIS
jgi:hypothetical protein